MKNKITVLVTAVLVLILCFGFSVSAQNLTHFTMNGAENGEKVSVNVKTDTLTGVGGMDFVLVYDSETFELDENSVRCSLDNCELVIQENAIRVLWDTTEEVSIPEVLLSADFKSIGSTTFESGMYFSINEYYDNTLELNDIPYEISFASADKIEKAKNSGFPVVLTVLLVIIGVIIAAAAVYLFLINKKIEEIAKGLIPQKIITES